METTGKENEEAKEMKCETIYIPSRWSANILQDLGKRGMKCHYMGIDPSGRIIMKMHYVFSPDNLLFLMQLEKEIEQFEQLRNILLVVGRKVSEIVMEDLFVEFLQENKVINKFSWMR